MRWLVALVALFASCSEEPPPDERAVTLALVKTVAEVAKACGDAAILEPLGCAKVSGARCQIVALDVRTGYDDRERLATWGHELRHCFRGPVHD